ncbi:hypothetical protein ACFL1R_07490 [Candidatus Latescibacterota bacterium]
MGTQSIGVVGLSVLGWYLVLNIAHNAFSAAGFDNPGVEFFHTDLQNNGFKNLGS